MTAPKLPAHDTDIDLMRDVYMTGAQREAYERILARAAVEASNLTGDNAEHVRVLKTMRSENYDWPVHSDKEASEIAALTAAIAALSAPKAEAVEGGEWRERYHDRCRVISDWHQRAVALGYDGVNDLLTLALPCIVNNAGDERPDKDNPND